MYRKTADIKCVSSPRHRQHDSNTKKMCSNWAWAGTRVRRWTQQQYMTVCLKRSFFTVWPITLTNKPGRVFRARGRTELSLSLSDRERFFGRLMVWLLCVFTVCLWLCWQTGLSGGKTCAVSHAALSYITANTSSFSVRSQTAGSHPAELNAASEAT